MVYYPVKEGGSALLIQGCAVLIQTFGACIMQNVLALGWTAQKGTKFSSGTKPFLCKLQPVMQFIKNIFSKIAGQPDEGNGIMYYSYYLFGLAVEKPVWEWGNWKKCMPLLQPIIDLSPQAPLIKTSQSIPVNYGKNLQYASYDKGALRFGTMLWTDQNNEKWTTKYCKEENWTFFDTEIAFPARSYCHKNGTNPELLITVHNENLTGDQNPKIDQSMSIHIRSHLIEKKKIADLEKYIYQIGAVMNWKIAGKIKRPTSYKDVSGMGYTDSFWDGTYGVLAAGNEDFSSNYKRYGIERIDTGKR